MKNLIFSLAVTALFSVAVTAQSTTVTSKASSDSRSSVNTSGKAIELHSAATITGQLQSSLNAAKANVGDQVVLKVTKSVKQADRVVVEKGSKLIGRVTDVRSEAKGSAGSSVAIVFDTLLQNGATYPVNVSVLAVKQIAGSAAAGDTFGSDVAATSQTRASASSSGGGLLGDVGGKVGGLVNATASTVGGVADTSIGTTNSVLGSASKTTGAVVGSASTNIRGLRVTQSTDSTASGSTSLSKETGNVKLNSGTNFTVLVNSSTSAGT